MKRAVAYLRVSTTDQAQRGGEIDGFSLPAQRIACERKAESLGAAVIEVYVDRGESAKSAHRPELQRMLSRLRDDRDVDYVIVHKIDRLARNRKDDVDINLTIQKAGAQLVSVSENIDETPSGMLLHGIMASISEWYSRNLATEIVKGSTQKARTGGTPYKPPLGYLNVRAQVNGREIRTVTVDPERASLIQWAFEAYATGEYGLIQLLGELDARGLRSRPTPKHPGKPLVLSNIANLLHNRYYIGKVTYRGVEYDGTHEPLVDPPTFDRVQSILEAHHLAGERQRVHHHYLKGTVYCAHCHSRMILTNAKGQYLYFFCAGRQRRNGCTQPYVLASAVEERVARCYASVQLEPERADAIRTGLRDAFDRAREHADRDRARQRRRLTTLRDQQRKLLDAHYADALPLDLFKDEQQRITREVAAIEHELKASNEDWDAIAEMLDQALDLAASCEQAYRLADPTIRRRYNQAFFERILIDRGDVASAQLAEPFAQLLAHDTATRATRETPNPGQITHGRGSSYESLVEANASEWSRTAQPCGFGRPLLRGCYVRTP